MPMSTEIHASLITPSRSAGSEAPTAAAYLRHEFVVESQVRRATLHVSAVGLIEPYLNGMRVGQDVLLPGWTSYRHRLELRSYDVTELIEEGANAIGAILGEGWAVGRLTWEADKRCIWSDRPAGLLQGLDRRGIEAG